MAKDKLIVTEGWGGFHIEWWLADLNETGATVGEDRNVDLKMPPVDREQEAWECWTAHKTCVEQGCEQDERGFFFETKREAKRVLKLINAAFRQVQNGPIPEWIQTALKNGCKPPKSWGM